MKAIHFVPSIADEASGPSYSVPALCAGLATCGVDVELHVTGMQEGHESSYPTVCHKAEGKLCVSPALKAMLKEEQSADVYHTHSLWAMTNVYPVKFRSHKTKVIAAPRGTLAVWALNRSKWKKRAMWLAFQKRALLQADCLHATSEKEYQEIRDVGLSQPVAIIPNGIDIHQPYKTWPTHENRLKRLLFFWAYPPCERHPHVASGLERASD